MAQNPAPEQPPRRRTRRKPAPIAPTIEVVQSAGGKPKRRRGVPASGLFRTQPIPGTELTVRDASVGQTDDMLSEAADADLDDREFTVRAVHRQIRGQPVPTIEDVRAWSDEDLLAGAAAMLSFPPLHILIDGVPQLPEEEGPIPDPLTFAAFREALASGPKRMYSSLADTARRISALGVANLPVFKTSDLFDNIVGKSTIDATGAGQNVALTGLGRNPAMEEALKSIKTGSAIFDIAAKAGGVSSMAEMMATSPALKMKLPELDFMSGALGQIKALSDTTGIARSLTKLQASTRAMEHLAKPIDFPIHESLTMPDIRPFHPEVDAIRDLEVALGERLEQIAQTQAKTSQDELEVLTGQAELIRAQGITVGQLVVEMKGLRDDQRWPNRAVIAAAFLAGVGVMVGIIAAVAAVLTLLRP